MFNNFEELKERVTTKKDVFGLKLNIPFNGTEYYFFNYKEQGENILKKGGCSCEWVDEGFTTPFNDDSFDLDYIFRNLDDDDFELLEELTKEKWEQIKINFDLWQFIIKDNDFKKCYNKYNNGQLEKIETIAYEFVIDIMERDNKPYLEQVDSGTSYVKLQEKYINLDEVYNSFKARLEDTF